MADCLVVSTSLDVAVEAVEDVSLLVHLEVYRDLPVVENVQERARQHFLYRGEANGL